MNLTKTPPSRFFGLLAVANVIGLSLAVYFYNGQWRFGQYPFSYAGWTVSQLGLPNLTSQWLYGLDMLAGAVIMLGLAIRYFWGKSQHNRVARAWLALIAASGFLLAAISPDDSRHQWHVIGSALFIAALWILATSYLVDTRHHLGRRRYLVAQAILQVPIFTYATIYFANADPAALFQKISLATLTFTLIYGTVMEDRFRLV